MAVVVDRQAESELAALVDRAQIIGAAVARRCKVPHLRDELASAALLGLAEAHASWREGAGSTFETWANFRMHQRAWDAVRKWLGRHHGKEPQAARRDFEEWQLDERIGTTQSIEDEIFGRMSDGRDAAVFDVLAALPPRTQDAVLAGARRERLVDVAERWGCTESRLSQLRSAAFPALREAARPVAS